MKAPNIKEKFALLIKNYCFSNLLDSKNPKDLCALLADDFGLKYSFVEDSDYFVKVSLIDYLQIYFIDAESKLINKPLLMGEVFLNINDFARFLSEKAYARVLDSLPIPEKNISKNIIPLARSIDSQLVVMEKKNFDFKLAGKIDPNLFPPCMGVLYADQLAGKKLSYMGRLALASFLFQLGMSKTELMTLYSKSPDFKKHIAEYHINRIFEKELSAPGCVKMFEYGLKVPACEKECKYKHPFRFYLSKLRVKNRMKNANSNGGKEDV
jgi:DNA primase large subunit